MTLINEFIEDYRVKIGLYEDLAKKCAEICERHLKRLGLRVLVTHRAKRIDSLANKVASRAKDKCYQSLEDIYDDIVDLAGVRLALYFPGDQREVDYFLRHNFIVDQIKDFPESQNVTPAYQKRFSGYVARHYRLKMKPADLLPSEQHLAERTIEVQVGSVLMHAWAEIEHDLVYKSTKHPLSQDEYLILDELNGLMHAGEIALERLQRAVKQRINFKAHPFANHFELSAFLLDQIRARNSGQGGQISVGRCDVAFEFLRRINLIYKSDLKPIVARCRLKPPAPPLTEQIVDNILLADPKLYYTFDQARLTVANTDPFCLPCETISYFSQENYVGTFIQEWIRFEQLLTKGIFQFNSAPSTKSEKIQAKNVNKLEKIKKLRNNILYGSNWPSADVLQEGLETLRVLAGKDIKQAPFVDRNHPN